MHVFATTVYAIMLLILMGTLAYLFTEGGKERVQKTLRRNTPGPLECAFIALCVLYGMLLFALQAPDPLLGFSKFFLCIFWPSYCFYSRQARLDARHHRPRLLGTDIIGISGSWILFDLHLVGGRFGARWYQTDWPFISLSLALVVLTIPLGRNMRSTNLRLRFSWADTLYATYAFAILAILLIPLGLASGFIAPQSFIASGSVAEKMLILFFEVASFKFLIAVIGIAIFTALLEELVFRVILQNWLLRETGNAFVAILATSICFGLSHLNNGATGFSPAGWSWMYAGLATIAGLAYGIVFTKTKSIIYPVTLHGLVDATWHTFFR